MSKVITPKLPDKVLEDIINGLREINVPITKMRYQKDFMTHALKRANSIQGETFKLYWDVKCIYQTPGINNDKPYESQAGCTSCPYINLENTHAEPGVTEWISKSRTIVVKVLNIEPVKIADVWNWKISIQYPVGGEQLQLI
jgi:hypothetical protein